MIPRIQCILQSFVLLVKCFDCVLSPMFLQYLQVAQNLPLPAMHQIITISYPGQKKSELDSHRTCLHMHKPELNTSTNGYFAASLSNFPYPMLTNI